MHSPSHQKLHMALSTAAMALGAVALIYAASAHGRSLSVSLQGFNGQNLGSVKYETQPGGTTLDVAMKAMSEGWYEVEIHEKGICTGEGFAEAGRPIGAVTVKRNDGLSSADDEKVAGGNAGMIADASGAAAAEFFASNATHSRLNDKDGSAVIVHSKRPEDAEGGRNPAIACGVIAPPQP